MSDAPEPIVTVGLLEPKICFNCRQAYVLVVDFGHGPKEMFGCRRNAFACDNHYDQSRPRPEPPGKIRIDLNGPTYKGSTLDDGAQPPL